MEQKDLYHLLNNDEESLIVIVNILSTVIIPPKTFLFSLMIYTKIIP